MTSNPQIETQHKIYGEVVAREVSLEHFMEFYAGQGYEYIDGVVITISPVTVEHDELTYYVRQFLSAYFELRPIGIIKSQPFVLRLEAFPNRRREPDLMVILNSNPHELKSTYMDGPADIVIEVVSEESIERDHGEKFVEYEKGGVPEYWILDRLHQDARFYRLDAEGRYIRQPEDAEGSYNTPALPGLRVKVPTLWQDALPGPAATAEAVRAMLES